VGRLAAVLGQQRADLRLRMCEQLVRWRCRISQQEALSGLLIAALLVSETQTESWVSHRHTEHDVRTPATGFLRERTKAVSTAVAITQEAHLHIGHNRARAQPLGEGINSHVRELEAAAAAVVRWRRSG